MFRRHHSLHLFAGALAFVACAVSAPLPMGLLPKIAGPCGRALCYCQTFDAQRFCCPERRDCRHKTPVPAVWTLGGQSLSAADAPGLAFELVVTASESPETSTSAVLLEDAAARLPLDHRTRFSSHIDDVAVPPPRA